jgi:ABC-type nitrate/sulfonate/bicarbonate transport system permease component
MVFRRPLQRRSAALSAPIDAVWSSLNGLVRTEEFWSAIGVTLSTIAKAYSIAVVLGVLAGYLVTRSRFLTSVLEPIISALFSIPITLFLPLFILVFGIGTASKVAYGAAYGFFPIALNTIAGLSRVDRRYLAAARALGISAFGTVRHVLWPAAFPVILTGLRIGFFIALCVGARGAKRSPRWKASAATSPSAPSCWSRRACMRGSSWSWAAALVLNSAVSAIENRMRGE